MKTAGLALRIARYIWPAPATIVGLGLAVFGCSFGATIRLREGLIEVAGGRLAAFARSAPQSVQCLAITFTRCSGLAKLAAELDIVRRQEMKSSLLQAAILVGNRGPCLAACREWLREVSP